VEGVPVRWEKGTVGLGVASGSVLRGISAEAAGDALADALSTWASVTCPGSGGVPDLSIASLGVLDGATVGFVSGGANQGVTAFYDEEFPGGGSAIARTLLGLNLRTGEILDADVILNSEGFPLAQAESASGGIDLVAVLTHEIGHVLGLDHSDVPGATMQAETRGFGTAELRTLEPDDVEGLCALYPPRAAGEVDPGSEPEPPSAASGCTLSSPPGSARAGTGWLGIIGALLGLRRLGQNQKQRPRRRE